MASAEVLYTPQVLALAASLSEWPLGETMPLQGSARSKSCGSVIKLGLETDGSGCISHVGVKAQACAIGQAAAAIFAGSAAGKSGDDVATAESAIRAWLTGEAERPAWPRLELLDAARAYPARHGAILLAWQAARELLPSGEKGG